MKKLILIASVLLLTQSSFAISFGIAASTGALQGEPAPMLVGPVSASTTSTFAGPMAGLIVFADNGEAMLNVESEQAFELYDQLIAKKEIKELNLSDSETHFLNLMEQAHNE